MGNENPWRHRGSKRASSLHIKIHQIKSPLVKAAHYRVGRAGACQASNLTSLLAEAPRIAHKLFPIGILYSRDHSIFCVINTFCSHVRMFACSQNCIFCVINTFCSHVHMFACSHVRMFTCSHVHKIAGYQ